MIWILWGYSATWSHSAIIASLHTACILLSFIGGRSTIANFSKLIKEFALNSDFKSKITYTFFMFHHLAYTQ